MLKVKNVSKKYNRYIIKKFNYEFSKGLYLVIGESGVGKSTLLNILGGFDKHYEGKIQVNKEMLFFKDCLPNDLYVREVIKIFELANDIKIINYLDIKKLMNKKIKKLSLGEKQLIILNLCLNSKSEIIILDEPFSALSNDNYLFVVSLIENLAKNKCIIIATHKLDTFKNYTIIDLENHKSNKIKEIDNFRLEVNKKFKIKYYLIYLKKTLIKKIIFIASIIFTILSFFYVNNYSDNLVSEYLQQFDIEDGVIIEKRNENIEINDSIFYEIIKNLSPYIKDYNAGYYSSKLYGEDMIVNGLYIDNAIVLSTINYIEENLKDNEIVLGINYNQFCVNNKIYDCDINYIKSKLINKSIDKFYFYVKDVFYSENTIVLTNERFIKVYEENEYIEYYFSFYKEDKEQVFNIINNNDFLLSFDFVKIGENEEMEKYKVEVDNKKNFNKDIEYSSYFICLEKGYNCKDYSKRMSSLFKIDDYEDIENLNLKIIDYKIGLTEIIVSSKLSEKLNKNKGDIASFYFEYNDLIKKVDFVIVDIIETDKYSIYHNSNWSYEFYEKILNYSSEDLIIKNIIIFEDIKKDYYKSENIYEDVIKEINNILFDVKSFVAYINIIFNGGSIIILLLLELFYNKFKKEYFEYLKMLSIKKCSIKEHKY